MRYSFELLRAALNGIHPGEKVWVVVHPLRTDTPNFSGRLVGISSDGDRLIVDNGVDYVPDVPAEWVFFADVIS